MQSETAQCGLTVVGIGEDGWGGLSETARAAVLHADVLIGSSRQLELTPVGKAERRAWPVPLLTELPSIVEESRQRHVVVLASGDPLLHGIGATFARNMPEAEFHCIPHVSAFSLACARMRWPADEAELVSLVHKPLAILARYLSGKRRLIVYSRDRTTPQTVADFLLARGFGASALDVFTRLGGPQEMRYQATAATLQHRIVDDLNLMAITIEADPNVPCLSEVPGLPDTTFDHDGQITKRHIRAITLACLAPRPGELLWDVGAGSGSIGIEWLRAHPQCRAIAFEAHPERLERIRRNAANLGVPHLQLAAGPAPETFSGQEAPDAVFLGGGVSIPGFVDACWQALKPGGRMVVNAVTLESEAVVLSAATRLGGTLTRIDVAYAEPIGGMQCWRPALPITQWTVKK